MKLKSLVVVLLLGVLIALGLFYMKLNSLSQSSQVTQTEVAQVRIVQKDEGLPIGAPFKLNDHMGNVRTDKDFQGKFMIVYFGYSYCPDVCPTGLLNLVNAMDLLGVKAKQTQVLFITVDPQRDTVANLATYMENYGHDFIALTGSESDLAPVLKGYHVYAQKAQEDRGAVDYLIDHSSIIYVMDPNGQYLTSFNHQTPPKEIIKILSPYLD